MQPASCTSIDDEPTATFIGDDGTVVHGAAAVAAFSDHVNAVQEHNRNVLGRMKPHERARLAAWLRNRTSANPPVRPSVGALIVPRTRAREHRPAATRRASSSSRTASQDPGSDDGPSESPTELVARRFRKLDAFVERHGVDYWDRHTEPPNDAQLELGEAV